MDRDSNKQFDSISSQKSNKIFQPKTEVQLKEHENLLKTATNEEESPNREDEKETTTRNNLSTNEGLIISGNAIVVPIISTQNSVRKKNGLKK